MSEQINFKQIEYHQVHVHKEMAVDNDFVEEQGLTVQRFKEVLSWQDESYSAEHIGDEPSDEEIDIFNEIIWNADCVDSEEDWFSDRKGGYDISYQLIEETE